MRLLIKDAESKDVLYVRDFQSNLTPDDEYKEIAKNYEINTIKFIFRDSGIKLNEVDSFELLKRRPDTVSSIIYEVYKPTNEKQ